MTDTAELSARRAADAAAISQGVRVVLNRKAEAMDAFVATLAEGMPEAFKAEAVFNLYLKNKLVKYDGMRFTVKHGAYLDRDVLLRAEAMV